MPATSNRTRLGIIREVTPGTIPATPAFQALRFLSGGLTAKPKTTRSHEVRSDRNVPDVILVGKDVGGQIDVEFSWASYDLLLEAAMSNAWVKTPEFTGVSSVAAGTGVYTVASGGAAVQIGSYIKASGFTNAANNGYFRVTASTGTTITTTNAASVAEGAPPAASRLKVVGLKGAANGNITATAGGTNTISVTGVNPTTLGLVPGMWFQAIGFAVAADNGWYRVLSISGTGPWTITCDVVPTGFATDAAAGVSPVLAFGDYLRNGTTRFTHAIEKAMLDAPAIIYQYYKGMQVDTLDLTIADDAILTASLGFMGMDSVDPSLTQFAGATSLPAGTSPVLNSSTSIGRIAEALAPLNGGSLNLPLGGKFSLKNNLRQQGAIGQLATAGVGLGTFECTGELQLYLDTPSILAKVMANTASSYDMRVADGNGAGYVLDVPTIKYLDGDIPTPAENQDITPTLQWQGILTTPVSGNPYTTHIQKFELVQ
jgi:hypothetical protein